MINVSSDFKNLTKKIKQQNCKITLVESSNELDIKETIFNFEGQLFKTIMKQITVKMTTVDTLNSFKGKNLNFKYGLFINNQFEFANLGDFYIKDDPESDKGAEELEITAYDKMVHFMKIFKQSDLNITYPCTLLLLIQKMCEICGVELYSTDFFNSSLTVNEDYFTAQEITYRDVLDKVAQATLTTIYIKENKLYLAPILNTAVETLDRTYLKKLVITDKFGPVNALVLGRGDVEDNVEAKDDTSIAQNGRCEIRFDENEFIEYQREQVINNMFEKIKGLTYYGFEGSDVGIIWLEPIDSINLKNYEDDIYNSYYLQANITINTGIKSDIEATIPVETETEYKVTTEEEKKTLKVERLAKKNEGLIQDLVKETEENTEKIASLELTSNGFKVTVSKKADTDKVVSIFNQSSDKIEIKSNRISIQSTYFTLNKDGTMTATAGSIGGINITDTGLFWSGTAITDGFGLWKINTHKQGDNSIIFHAGANNSNIGNAGVRILQNGSTYMKNLIVESDSVNVSEGNTGGGINILGSLPFIDFHANNATNFTTRLIDYGSRFLIASDYDISLVNRTNQTYRNLYLSRLLMDGDNVLIWQSEGNMLLSSITGVSIVNQNNSSYNRINASEFCFAGSPITMKFSALQERYIGFRANNGIRIVNEDGSAYTAVRASEYLQNSSKRYKENIKNISKDEANKILDLRVVTFDYKEDSMMTGTNVAGLIAEETFEKIPNVVSTTKIDDEEVPDAIDYSKLVPYLIKEVQILNDELIQMRKELNNLKMVYDIYIKENTEVVPNEELRAMQGENNVSILNFTFPETIATLDSNLLNKYIIFSYKKDGQEVVTDPLQIVDNSFTIPASLTGQEELETQVLVKKDSVLLFKSEIFEIILGESLPLELHIDFDDLDVLNTVVEQYKQAIADGSSEIEALKTEIETLSTSIQDAENKRVLAENSRVEAEENRQTQFEETLKKIKDLTEAYNSNATEKTEDFNKNYDKKVESINSLVSYASSSASAAASSAEQASKTAESASQAITSALNSAKSALNSYEQTKEDDFDTYYEGKEQEFESVKTDAVSSVNTAKDTAVSDINIAKTTAISDFNNNASGYEKKHYKYRVVITEEVEALTEYELPCNYKVGDNSLEIFYNNELLIKEASEDMEANYREVGTAGNTSNKVVFGWTLPIGSILNILVKGDYENETE